MTPGHDYAMYRTAFNGTPLSSCTPVNAAAKTMGMSTCSEHRQNDNAYRILRQHHVNAIIAMSAIRINVATSADAVAATAVARALPTQALPRHEMRTIADTTAYTTCCCARLAVQTCATRPASDGTLDTLVVQGTSRRGQEQHLGPTTVA